MPATDILEFLRATSPRRVAIATHLRPDGDAVGACLALAHGLAGVGIEARIMNAGSIPRTLAFLGGAEFFTNTQNPDWWRAFDCLAVLDCGEEGRLEEANRPALALPTFTIDHHASSAGLGPACWIEADASSTGEMIVRLFQTAGWALPAPAAQALWTAIAADTGRFSFENTTVPALEAALFCLKAGAQPAVVANNLFQSVTRADRLLEKVILERMEFFEDGRLASAWLAPADFAAAGAGPEGAQDKINILRGTVGVEAAVFFYQFRAGDGIKVSLRTESPHDALVVTGRFGGGGHRRAAGCTVAMPMDAARAAVLAAAREVFFGA